MGLRRCVYLIAGAGLLAGCASGGISGPVLTSGTTLGGGGSDAQVMGTVVLDGDCRYLESDGIRYPVIWPAGTSWQADPPAVKITGGAVPMAGEVTGGGGYSSAAQLADLGLPIPPEVIDAAAACVTDTNEIALFNPGSKVISAEPTTGPAT